MLPSFIGNDTLRPIPCESGPVGAFHLSCHEWLVRLFNSYTQTPREVWGRDGVFFDAGAALAYPSFIRNNTLRPIPNLAFCNESGGRDGRCREREFFSDNLLV